MADDFEDKLASIEEYYHWTYEHLKPADLRRQLSWLVTGKELAETDCDGSEVCFLDYYSSKGLRTALERYGFFDALREKGLADPQLSIRRHEEGYDIVRIRQSSSESPLIELVAQAKALPWEARVWVDPGERKFLYVKWLRMQNPCAKPTPERPLFPGQDFPGLGLGLQMMVLLQLICDRLELDGVLEIPERIHNAVMYFKRFRFLNPEMQGKLTAILRDTRECTLAELAWGSELGNLIDLSTGRPFRWMASLQALPRTGPVLAHLNSPEYRDKARETMENCHFTLETGNLQIDRLASEEQGSRHPGKK